MSSELQTGLILFGIATIVGWGVWITRSVMDINKSKKDFDKLESKVTSSLEDHDKRQKEMEGRVSISIDNFDKTLHLWKNTMIDELRSVLKDVRFNRGRQRAPE